MNKNKRSLDEEIKRMKHLSLIKEDVANPTHKEVEDKVDLIINTPEFENELSSAMSMFAKDVPNQLRLIGTNMGDNDGNIESGGIKSTKNDGQTIAISSNDVSLAGINFKEALRPTKLTQLLGNALRNSGIDFDLQSLRNAGEKLSEISRITSRNYYKTIYVGIKPIISEMSDDQKKEFTGKLLLGAVLIASVWSIQTIINAYKSGEDIEVTPSKSQDMFEAIKLNLPRWVDSLVRFDVY